MLTHYLRGLCRAESGLAYTYVSGLPWAGGQVSLLNGASPAVEVGDIMVAPLVTSPDGYQLAMSSTGVPVIYANGDTAGQHFNFDVYDWSLRKYYGTVVEYMNNHSPAMLDTQPHTIALIRNVTVDIDLTDYVVDQEHDPLVVTTSDGAPPGMSFASNHLTGTPDTPGSYPMHFTATDPAGGSVVYPLFTFVVGNESAQLIDQTLTIFKVKAGPTGPSGGGTDGITVNLTKSSFSVMCYADGNVVDPLFNGVDGYCTVFKGATDDTAAATLSATGTGLTGTINTATDTPVIGQPKGYYRVTGITADNATLNITAVDSGATITRQFTVNKVRAGIEIVTSLPVSNLFNGRTVFLTTDGKLYRYVTGTGWTTLIPAGDISGQITSTQIADDAITTPKIAANAITAAEIAANAITANAITAGAITAAKVAASNVITATAQIGDLIVTTLKIAGDAVSDSALIFTQGNDDIDVDALSSPIATPVWYDLSGSSLSYTASGGRIQCAVHVAVPGESAGAANDYIMFRLLRDGSVEVGRGTIYTNVLANQFSGIMGWFSGFYYDTPSAATHTYKLQYACHATGGGGIQPRARVRERCVQLQELKR